MESARLGDYADLNNHFNNAKGYHHSGSASLAGGVAEYNKSAKAMKNLNSVASENLRKINQRS